MHGGLLASNGYKFQFSGHETFPLRQLWLRKAYDAVSASGGRTGKAVFSDADAIARFGVGKNMVSAIRHWALACDVLRETDAGAYSVGPLGERLFGNNGLDPYLEHPATPWLVHWHLAGEGRRSTTWYWVFNHILSPAFQRDEIANSLRNFCSERQITRVSDNTLLRDIDVCLRSYCPRGANTTVEDLVEPVLGELGLIAHVRGSEFVFRIGHKPSLPDGVLWFALTRFWSEFASTANTLSLDVLAYARGSLGTTFKLDVDSLVERLVSIEDSSRGAYAWSETAGLKQVIKKRDAIDPFNFLKYAYRTSMRS